MLIREYFIQRGFKLGQVFKFEKLICHVNEKGAPCLITIVEDPESEDGFKEYWQWPDESIRRSDDSLMPSFESEALQGEELEALNLEIERNLQNFDKQARVVELVKDAKFSDAKEFAESSQIKYLNPFVANRALVFHVKQGNLPETKFLLNYVLDPNVADDEGSTLLMLAAANGDLNICEALVEAKTNIHAKDRLERTALDYAINNLQLGCCDFLFSQKAPYNNRRLTPAACFMISFLSIKQGTDDYIRYMNVIGDVNKITSDGVTMLYYAVENKNENALMTLMMRGADPDIICLRGAINPDEENISETALHCAITDNQTPIVQRLLARIPKINLEIEDSLGSTPLQRAVLECCDIEITQALVDAGARINTMDPVVDLAIGRDNLEAIELILANPRFDHTVLDSDGLEVLQVASKIGSPEALSLVLEKLKSTLDLQDLEDVVNGFSSTLIVMTQRANLEVKTENPLHLVLDEWKSKTNFSSELQDDAIKKIKMLVDYGANLNRVSINGMTILQKAVLLSSPDLVDYLLAVGIENINHQCRKNQNTALHLALTQLAACGSEAENERDINNFKKIITLLVEKGGADVDIINGDNKSSYELAESVKEKHYEIFELLETAKGIKESLKTDSSESRNESFSKRVKQSQDFLEKSPSPSPEDPATRNPSNNHKTR